MGEAREIDDQLRQMMERIEEILSSHPAAIYLPCFYRSGPPRVFLQEDAVRILTRGSRVLHYEVEPFDLAQNGYRVTERGLYHLVYEFLPGKRFEVQLEGTIMEKSLPAGGLIDEVGVIREYLGIYDLVRLVGMRGL